MFSFNTALYEQKRNVIPVYLVTASQLACACRLLRYVLLKGASVRSRVKENYLSVTHLFILLS